MTMKIGISTKGNTADALIEERFGRSPFFLIIDSETSEVKAVTNPHSNDTGGVGPKAAQLLLNEGVNVVLTGQVGGNAFNALKASGLEVYACNSGTTATQAVAEYKNGALKQLV